MAANSLFDPIFNPNPDSFKTAYITATNDASISWDLQGFTSDTNVSGTLCFVTYDSPYTGIYDFNATTFKPLTLTKVSPQGSLLITGLSPSRIYACYMKLTTPNGWIRNSVTKYVFPANMAVSPSKYDFTGLPDASSARTNIGFDISSNTPWVASFIQNPDNFMYLGDPSTMFTYDGSLYINITDNASTNGRTGIVRISPTLGGLNIDVSVYQPRGTIGPELFLYATGLHGAWPVYEIDASAVGEINGMVSVNVDVSSNRPWSIDILPAGATLTPDFGPAGLTSTTLTVSQNLLMTDYYYDNIVKAFTFDYGTASPITLNVVQDNPKYTITPYYYPSDQGFEFDVNGNYIFGEGSDYIDLEFEDNLPVPWQLFVRDTGDGTSWFNLNFVPSISGVGNEYGIILSCYYNATFAQRHCIADLSINGYHPYYWNVEINQRDF
jgi:hypothetical protein